jgi:hypothetical protein
MDMIPIELKTLHKKLYEGILEKGEYFFTKDDLLNAFSYSFDKEEYKNAVQNILAFNKDMNKKKMEIMKVGFIKLDPSQVSEELKEQTRSKRRFERVQLMMGGIMKAPEEQEPEMFVGFTYTVQSKKHMNQPLFVVEQFALDYPLLALVSFTAEIWNHAYVARPQHEIDQVAKGF